MSYAAKGLTTCYHTIRQRFLTAALAFAVAACKQHALPANCLQMGSEWQPLLDSKDAVLVHDWTLYLLHQFQVERELALHLPSLQTVAVNWSNWCVFLPRL